MARQRRAAAQAAAASLRNSAPVLPNLSDEEMVDADIPQSSVATPRDEDDDDGEEEEIDGAATPAQESEGQSQPATPQLGRMSAIPRKRRLGRPPKNRPPDYDDGVNNDAASDAGTPSRGRGRGRGRGGGRWAKAKGGPSHVTQVPIDKEGNMMDVIDDEVDLPEDLEGEEKVDKMGNLQGGRDYRVRVFTIYGRGQRLYMLSTEPARCIGFRDSYLFFQKHRLLYKIIISEDEKRDLIDRDIIPHSYKGRAIGVVTARSVFREFGAKIIIGGKKVIDDYQTHTARVNGDVEGELAVPEDKLPPPHEPYNKNQYVAWFGASSVYHSGAPSVPMPGGVDFKKKRVTVTGDNWMLEHCKAAAAFNSQLTAMRKDALNGVYNIHTNVMEYPKSMQPTHARWEPVLPADFSSLSLNDDAHSTNNGEMILDSKTTDDKPKKQSDIFPDLDPVYARNFMIHDIHYESAPHSNIGIPGPDGDYLDRGPNGLSNIPDDILAELPVDCRREFDKAVSREVEWKNKWRTEKQDGHRGTFLPTYSWAGYGAPQVDAHVKIGLAWQS